MKRLTCCMTLLAALVSGCSQTRFQSRSESPLKTDVVARKPASVESAPEQRDGSEEPDLIVHADGPKPTSSGWKKTSAQTLAEPNPLPPAPAAQSAAPSNGLSTLGSFEQLAVSSNPTLTELQARVDAANGRWVQVGLKPNPVAGVSGQEIGNEGAAGQYGAFVGQEFVTANKLELNRNAASWNVKRAEQQLAAQRLRVLTDVRRSFYSVRVAQERVKIAEELQGIALQAVEKAKELVKVQEPETVLTQAEIEAELAGVLIDNARIQREALWRALAAVVGQPDLPLQDVEAELTTSAPQVVWEQTLERIRRESPEVAAAAATVEQSRWALQRASVQATPNVTMQAGVFYDDSSNDPFATLQLSLPIPIYDRNQGGIAEAHANVLAAEQAVQRVELSLQQRLAAVYQQYGQARQQASRYEGTILKKAKRNLDLNRQSYEAGDSAYLAVLTAQRSYSQARLTWLNALEQLWSATVQIEGLLLRDSLQ